MYITMLCQQHATVEKFMSHHECQPCILALLTAASHSCMNPTEA